MSPSQSTILKDLALKLVPWLVMGAAWWGTTNTVLSQKLDAQRFVADSIRKAHDIRDMERSFAQIVGMYEDIRIQLRDIRCDGKPASCR
jgi:hypothetical protein